MTPSPYAASAMSDARCTPRPPPVSPLIEIGAAEEQLASTAVLMDRDRPLGSKLPKRVPMDAEILGCVARVEPLAGVVVRRVTKMLEHCGCQASRELVEQGVENQELGARCVGEGIRDVPSPAARVASSTDVRDAPNALEREDRPIWAFA